jgi:C-terminal processing protease CtpA/Prc
MYLKALPKPVPDTAVYDRSGMWINATSNDFEIIGITPGGPAEKSKLKVGEHIVAVNGNPVKPEQLSDFRMKLRDDPGGTIVHLTIKSQAGDREVALILRDQI